MEEGGGGDAERGSSKRWGQGTDGHQTPLAPPPFPLADSYLFVSLPPPPPLQADNPPGNILVGKGGRIGLLDYGQSKQLPDAERRGFARLLQAINKCGTNRGGRGWRG